MVAQILENEGCGVMEERRSDGRRADIYTQNLNDHDA
jgi:hypothetical protein